MFRVGGRDIRKPRRNLRLQTSDFKLTEFELWISDFRLQTQFGLSVQVPPAVMFGTF